MWQWIVGVRSDLRTLMDLHDSNYRALCYHAEEINKLRDRIDKLGKRKLPKKTGKKKKARR